MEATLRSLGKVGLSLGVTLSATLAFSQTDTTKALHEKLTAEIARMESSCAEDIKKYCSTVTPGEGRMLHCMQAHEDKISPKCAYDLNVAALNVQLAADRLKDVENACRDDIAKVCGTTQPGQGRLAACLVANKAAISQNCTEAVRKFEASAVK
jgi:hypothetical protein